MTATADVDALVAEIDPRVRPPAVRRRDVVLVCGAWLAGVSGVAAVLRQRLPDHVFVEAPELAAGEVPVAVVFVVSAAAAVTASDCALLDAAAAHTDAVVCAVSKTDVHRGWRDMLTAGRDTLAAHAPRYATTPWVATAAAPAVGESRVDELIEAVSGQLAAAELPRRNALRAWETRLQAATDRHDRDVDGTGRRARVAVLQHRREAVGTQRRMTKSERTVALRSQIQQARVQLTYFARNRCSSVRGELQESAGAVTRSRLGEFVVYVGGRVADVVAEVDEGTTARLEDVAHELDMSADVSGRVESPVVDIPEPSLNSRRLETRLMAVLGIGFGLGMTLTLGRMFADLAPGWALAGAAFCAVIGLVASGWVVNTRAVLRDRAVLDRWVGEVSGSLQSAVEQSVAMRVLSAESVLSTEQNERDAAESQQVAAEIRVIDGELAEHAAAAARAAALRDREAPALYRALVAVRTQLGEPSTGLREPETRRDGLPNSETGNGESGSINPVCPGV